jgi:hypothetical protein
MWGCKSDEDSRGTRTIGALPEPDEPLEPDEPEGVTDPAQINGHGTCAACRLSMRIIEPGQTTHPACKETAA